MRRVFRYAVCLSMAFFLLMGMASAQERWTVDELMGQAPPTALFAIFTNPPARQYEYIVPTHDFDWEGGGGDRLLVVCLQEDVRLELRRYCQRSGDMIHREIVRYDPPGQDRAREIVRYDPPPLGWRPGGDP